MSRKIRIEFRDGAEPVEVKDSYKEVTVKAEDGVLVVERTIPASGVSYGYGDRQGYPLDRVKVWTEEWQ
jgi:hypothetical protein